MLKMRYNFLISKKLTIAVRHFTILTHFAEASEFQKSWRFRTDKCGRHFFVDKIESPLFCGAK